MTSIQSALAEVKAAREAAEKAAEEARASLAEAKAERAAAEKAAANALAAELRLQKAGVIKYDGKLSRMKWVGLTVLGGLAIAGTVLGTIALARASRSNNDAVSQTTFLQTIRNFQLTQPQSLTGPNRKDRQVLRVRRDPRAS